MDDRGTPQHIHLKESSPWESRLLWFGALSLAGGVALGLGNWGEYGTWFPPLCVGVLLVGVGFSVRLLYSAAAHVERERLSIFSTMADDPTISHREVAKADIRAIEVMRTSQDTWFGRRPVWEVAALLERNQRQPIVRWEDPEQALQAGRSSARVLDVEFRDSDVEERPQVTFPTAQTGETFSEFARNLRDDLSNPSNMLYGVGFDASEDAVKLYLWKQQTRGLFAIVGSAFLGGMGALIVCVSVAISHLPRFDEARMVSGTMYVLGLFAAFVMLRHVRHLGQRNSLIVRPTDVAVQTFTADGRPVMRAIKLEEVEYVLVTRPPGLVVVAADREIAARGGISFRAYQEVSKLLCSVPGWPRHATVR